MTETDVATKTDAQTGTDGKAQGHTLMSKPNSKPLLARTIDHIVAADLAFHAGSPRPFRLARLLPGAAKYRNCWLLMDRDTSAHDNAEHLYRYLRDESPDINAWFVLSRKSADWPRLAAEGFRLVPHGSFAHLVALASCKELVSSQIDHYVVSPPIVFWLRRRPWRFTWLQHGVINYDLSGWLNPKPVTTVITTTPAERASMIAKPYVWTEREVVQTGMPRHDALIRKALAVPESDRNLILVMPTWRRGLLAGGLGLGNQRRGNAKFWESEYARNWLGLINSPAVAAAARRAGLAIVFMPHPTIAPVFAERKPEHVRFADYSEDDVQDLLAHAALVVTDFSSNAFEAALIDRPVLYFQFDKAEFFSGTHIGAAGYFDYERDGFGPVATTLPQAEQALVQLIAAGQAPQEPYATRIAQTFTVRDGRASERIVKAIKRHAVQ